ncbi:MAG: hypothetical protein LBU42_03295 [Prevotellaceae bacterium]|jgi:hypothetical protein|nr:hypothetical protein [Prevotellaceae bacterium]
MAKPSWAATSPSSGSGNGTVNISGSTHTGRAQRSGTLTYKASGVSDVPQSVTQEAKPEFVIIHDVSASKDGGNVTITGTTNSASITFALGAGDIDVSLPGNYSAGGAGTANGAAIAGDPGASAEFNFALTIAVPANGTIAAKSRVVAVTAAGGQQASATISQAAGDPVLSVSPASITLSAAGTAVAVNVTSNTNWTVE